VPKVSLAAGLLLLVLFGAGSVASAAGLPPPPVGRWLSQDHDGVFEIRICGQVLCGRLIGIRYEGAMPTDKEGHPQCGLMMLTGFVREQDDPGRWAGMILDPEHGRRYHAVIWSPGPGLLNLRGYLLLPLFGQTQRWTRYDGTIGPNCHLPG
jgi:uncharacterized protein (DUF2147 family)